MVHRRNYQWHDMIMKDLSLLTLGDHMNETEAHAL